MATTTAPKSIDLKTRAAQRNAEDALSLRRIAGEIRGWLKEAPTADPEVAGILSDCEALDRAAQLLATPPIYLPLTLVANAPTPQSTTSEGGR